MSESRISTTSPRASREAEAHRVALALAGLLQEAQGQVGLLGDDLLDHGLGVVVRAALDEEELAVGRQLGQARPPAGRMWPASFRQGMITLVLGLRGPGLAAREGEGRATIPNIRESQSKTRQVAEVAVEEVGDAGGGAAGQTIWRSRRTTSKSARASMFSISSGGSQASGGWRYLRPRASARRRTGCQSWL